MTGSSVFPHSSVHRVDVFDNDGRSALHLAADGGSMDVNMNHPGHLDIYFLSSVNSSIAPVFWTLRFFLLLGFKLFVSCLLYIQLFVPFHLYIRILILCLLQVCRLLLDKNAFVNSKTKLGWTALHFAANRVNWRANLPKYRDLAVIAANPSSGLHRSGGVPHQVWGNHR